jgi:hypothetical protein
VETWEEWEAWVETLEMKEEPKILQAPSESLKKKRKPLTDLQNLDLPDKRSLKLTLLVIRTKK